MQNGVDEDTTITEGLCKVAMTDVACLLRSLTTLLETSEEDSSDPSKPKFSPFEIFICLMILVAVEKKWSYLLFCFKTKSKRLKRVFSVLNELTNRHEYKISEVKTFDFVVGEQNLGLKISRVLLFTEELHVFSNEKSFMSLPLYRELKSKWLLIFRWIQD